ncbi:hypothetical protein D3C78_1895700 [compost metagenome]
MPVPKCAGDDVAVDFTKANSKRIPNFDLAHDLGLWRSKLGLQVQRIAGGLGWSTGCVISKKPSVRT